MKLFDNNPQSKAMQSLIHDTRNCGDAIRFHIQKLQNRLKELAVADTKMFVHLEYVRSNTSEIEKAIDTYYERFGNDFSDSKDAQFKAEIITAYNLTQKFLPDSGWTDQKSSLYQAFRWLIENYTLIRKLDTEQNVQECDATESNQGGAAGNQETIEGDGWVSVEDALPDKGEGVLVWTSQGVSIGEYIKATEDGFYLFDSPDWWGSQICTHWRKLPNPPQKTKQ